MKPQQGFVQIALLIAIIVGVLVLGSAGYFGVKQYQDYQIQKAEKEKLAQEVIKLQVERDQQKTEEQNNQGIEIERLKKDIQTLKSSDIGVVNKGSSNLSSEISSDELQPYINTIVEISCQNTSGSGSLWNLGGQYSVLTNYHVVKTPYLPDGHCNVGFTDNVSGKGGGFYSIYPSAAKSWNIFADVAFVGLNKQEVCDANGLNCFESRAIENLNYGLSFLNKCSEKAPINAPVVILGYPAFGRTNFSVKDIEGNHPNLIASNGVVSGYDDSSKQPIGNLPYSNYFVSAKIDSGNSGGIALSKNRSGLCVLGIPTWLVLGNYETQGLIQNIHNILYSE